MQDMHRRIYLWIDRYGASKQASQGTKANVHRHACLCMCVLWACAWSSRIDLRRRLPQEIGRQNVESEAQSMYYCSRCAISARIASSVNLLPRPLCVLCSGWQRLFSNALPCLGCCYPSCFASCVTENEEISCVPPCVCVY